MISDHHCSVVIVVRNSAPAWIPRLWRKAAYADTDSEKTSVRESWRKLTERTKSPSCVRLAVPYWEMLKFTWKPAWYTTSMREYMKMA